MSNKTGGKTFIGGLTSAEVEHIKLEEEEESQWGMHYNPSKSLNVIDQPPDHTINPRYTGISTFMRAHFA